MADFSQQRLWHWIKRKWFSSAQQLAFLEDLVALVEDGVSIQSAIEMMSRISCGLTAEVVEGTLFEIAAGRSFSEGMYGWFPTPVVEMVRAGEEGGTLIKAMRTAISAIEQKRSAVSSLFTALSYPLIVAFVCLAVVIFLNHSIFADFKQLLPLQYWPAHALYLMHFANFMQDWWWLLALGVVTVLLTIHYLLRHYTGSQRKWIDRLPFLSLYRVVLASRFMESLGMLIANGLVVKQAFDVLRRNANPYLRSHIVTMEYRLGEGNDSIGDVLDTGLISKADIFRLRLVTQTKSFENSLVRLGRTSARRAYQQILISGRVAGGIVLFLVASLAMLMIFSIYDVGSVLGSQ